MLQEIAMFGNGQRASVMQEAWAGFGKAARRVRLPARDAEVIPGVVWGSPECFNTPAYWAVRSQWETANPDYVTRTSVVREAAFCLLGGFGVRYEMNVAAYQRLDERGFFCALDGFDENAVRSWLLEPLTVNGRAIRYRFPDQRARRIARTCNFLSRHDFDKLGAAELRAALLKLDGLGPKTASWIVRNCLGSDEVAIIDVHLTRACQQMRVFPKRLVLPRDYAALEQRFLEFSYAINVRPSVLDAVIWSEARRSPSLRVAR